MSEDAVDGVLTALPHGPGLATDLAVPGAPGGLRPDSVRRTSHLEETPVWPEAGSVGQLAGITIAGVCRDVVVDRDGEITSTDEASLSGRIDAAWVIEALDITPTLVGVAGLIGENARRGFRKQVAEQVRDGAGTPGRFLLADLPTLAVIFHYPILRSLHAAGVPAREITPPESLPRMVDVCVGWASDHTAARVIRSGVDREPRALPLAPSVGDGWHDAPVPAEGTVRRVRRFDVWRDGTDVLVDAGYRDTYGEGGGTSGVIHEYGLAARFDADLRLVAVTARPQVLPFVECPMAADGVGVLTGVAAADLPEAIRDRLSGTRGCTHLNDLLSELVELPHLVARLPEAS